MNVNKLIGILSKVKDKSLPIRIIKLDENEITGIRINYWLEEVEVSDTGSSGYEVEGEVRLYGGV